MENIAKQFSKKLDETLSIYNNIEKKIHVTWSNKEIINKNYNLIKNGILQLKLLNPDYDFYMYDDNDIENYLKINLSIEEYDLIKNKHIVEKSDLWRLLIVYNEGGIYSDIDRLCNIPLSNIIDNNIKFILPMYYDNDFSQDIIISCSKNIFLKNAIDLNLKTRKNDPNTKLYDLGPTSYFKAITEILIGTQLNREPLLTDVLFLRDIINNSKSVKTYRESPPYNTILCKNFLESGFNFDYEKKFMYDNELIKHWNDTNIF